MTPEDPRHGTRGGYRAGCRLDCCRRAQTRYMKLYRMGRTQELIPALGTQRRIQALLAIGWTHRELGERLGRSDNYTHEILYNGAVRSDIAATIARVYEDLCMTVPQGWYPDRNRRYARALGFAPPLAWNDIDDPSEVPHVGRKITPSRDEIDEAVVLRILAGDRMEATRAEREEVVRRWIARGHDVNELARRTGWKIERYGRKGAA